MIPHSSVGGQPRSHPMRAFNGAPGRADLTQMASQYDPPSVSSQLPVVDLTASGYESQGQEPPSKRPKLSVSSGGDNIMDASAALKSADGRSTPSSASSRPSISWRGRPMWSFQAAMSDISGNENQGDGSAGSRPSSPPPFPAQPWANTLPERAANTSSRSRESSPVGPVSTVPYRIETPSAAPVIKGEKVADFTPWTGNHPEDVLNAHTAKSGYYDRTQVSQNESNTARPALYGQLKHRAGLQVLSSVFAATLEKRRNHNTIHAPSTFKPPPRVTLTDNKREGWLRDLANAAVPLRRLSRTIPHGIRGKVLLDQCLGKWIPVARAVWLAKCVGANEIRAFKRKGTSGALAVGLEAKWVRDWTTSVQQFVEGVFSSPRSNDWKARITYTVGLTARLFFENLLDHDHFIEWFLSSFESAPLATIPIWLLMLGIYWRSILRYRRRGRRLAELLLEKLRQATATKYDPLQPLIVRLSRFIKKLVHEHTSSMILPNTWDTYKNQVRACLDLSNKVDRALFQSIAERNARVQRPRLSKPTIQRPPHQRIISLFDTIHSTHDISVLSVACLDAVGDRTVLVSKLFEWLATPFRHGLCRVYVGVRLIRKWKAVGIDIDDHILRFLFSLGDNKKLNVDNIYHAISELVRSQTFSVGRYLQWLMARGVTSRSPSETQTAHELPVDIGLIAHLPVGRLPEHVGNLRSTLMARTGLAFSDETSMITSVRALVSQRLPSIFSASMQLDTTLKSLPLDLSWAVKAEIGQWLRRGVAEHTRNATTSTTRATLPGNAASSFSALTAVEFYSVLLASVADTTNRHFDSLCVIGATTDLFRKLVDAYAGIKRFGIPSLDLMFSLIELGLRIPNETNAVTFLRQDLSRMENKSVMAASSPVSDHIPDDFGEADPLFREKLDQLLLSGNVMDEPTLDTLFNTLTKHLESDDSKTKLSANDISRYLAQLRSFQPKHFDGILARWVCGLLRVPDRSGLLRVLPPLIGVGCVTIRSFLSLVKRLSLSTKAIPNAADLPTDLVQLLVLHNEENRYLDLVSYRFQLAQQEFLAKNSEEALALVCNAAASLNASCPKPSPWYHQLEGSMVSLLCELLVRNPECASQQCMQKLADQYSEAMGIVQKALDLLLGVDSQSKGSSVISEVEKLATITDDFSLPFCRLKLQLLFHGDSAGDDRNNVVDAMFRTIVADSRAPKHQWIDLIGLMSPEATRQIRERAEKEFFAIPLFEYTVNDQSTSPRPHGSLEAAKMYLTIIDDLANSVPESGAPSTASIIVEKMDALLHKMIIVQSKRNNPSDKQNEHVTTQGRSNFERSLAFWFAALLRMVVIHRASFMQPSPTLKIGTSNQQCRILVSIFCIALCRLPGDVLRQFPGADYFPRPAATEDFRPCPGILLQTHALDVAASLIDIFPDEVRHQCGRFLKEKCPPFIPLQNDSRFLYLLGPMSDSHPSSILQSASVASPVASASTPTPTSTTFPAAGASSQQTAGQSSQYSGFPEGSDGVANWLQLQDRGRLLGPYTIRPWELLEDAAPFVGVNDTAVNLGYFDARRTRV
ncbi:hypothetical protein N7462_001591 [Penicillium macrosclerotiorum]|uniref:uncharacterized protein n=1 Tax=Penicillium macrosclerotiorum TaxID=303699 RepID=UPI0025495528|nr:uncharacterized protein N7462_001591 [Penicillium macrosclerotiorum]KAJ5692168.1 hypothetical protein N7462_001591 [Penicillium macrosclerotiorum]